MIGDAIRLADQLIGSRLCYSPVSHLVDVSTVRNAGSLPTDRHAKSHQGARRTRTHDEVQIARVEAIDNPTLGLVQNRGLLLDGPSAQQRPVIHSQSGGRGVDTASTPYRPAGRDHALLRFVPTLRVVPVTTNCGAIWMALTAGNTPPGVERLSAGAAMRIWRVGFSSHFCTIDAIEQRAIALVQNGASFGSVCNTLAEGRDPARVAEAAGQLLAVWLRDGMIAAIDTQKGAG